MSPDKAESGGSGKRIFTALFVSLIALNFLASVMAQMNTAGSPLLSTRFGGTAVLGGFMVTTFTLACLVSRLVCGYLADRFTRKSVLLTGSAVYICGSLLAVFAPDLGWLVFARVFQGWGYASVHVAASTCAADVLPQERLGEGLGYYGLGHAIAIAVGPMFGTALAASGPFWMLGLGALSTATIALCVGIFVRYEKHPEMLPSTSGYRRMATAADQIPSSEGLNEADHQKQGECTQGFFRRLFEWSALSGGVSMFLIGCTIDFFISFATVFATSCHYAQPGLFFLIAAGMAAFVRFVGAKIIDALPALAVLAIPVVFGLSSLALMYFVRTETAYWLSGIGYGICLGYAIPLLSSVAVKRSHPSRWGAANALFYCLYDLGVGSAAVLWGALLDAYGFPLVFIGSALCLVAAYFSGVVLFPRSSESAGGHPRG